MIKLFRDHSVESDEATTLLKRAHIEHATIYTDTYNEPRLLVPDEAYSYKGIKEITQYIKYNENLKNIL